MPNARIPSVEIRFGGETRKLIYDYNALAELQDLAGTYLSDVSTMKSVRAVVWAGLLAETLDRRGKETERTLSLIQVGDILLGMEKAEIDALIPAIQEARGVSEPDPPKAIETEIPTPKS